MSEDKHNLPDKKEEIWDFEPIHFNIEKAIMPDSIEVLPLYEEQWDFSVETLDPSLIKIGDRTIIQVDPEDIEEVVHQIDSDTLHVLEEGHDREDDDGNEDNADLDGDVFHQDQDADWLD